MTLKLCRQVSPFNTRRGLINLTLLINKDSNSFLRSCQPIPLSSGPRCSRLETVYFLMVDYVFSQLLYSFILQMLFPPINQAYPQFLSHLILNLSYNRMQTINYQASSLENSVLLYLTTVKMFHKFRNLKHKCQSTKKTFICQSVGEEERTKKCLVYCLW